MYNSNPFGYPYPQANLTPQEQIARLNQQMQEYGQMLRQYPGNQAMPNMAQQTAMSNRGVFVYVNDYQEVLNYPTNADGNATLFVNLDKGLLWSKKFVNGSNSIQTFSIAPLNNFNKVEEEPVVETKPQEATAFDALNERVFKLEDSIDKILKALSVKPNNTNNNGKKES